MTLGKTKYLLLHFTDDSWADGNQIYASIVNTYDDYTEAEKARCAFLTLYPKTVPNNLQVTTYSDYKDEIPF